MGFDGPKLPAAAGQVKKSTSFATASPWEILASVMTSERRPERVGYVAARSQSYKKGLACTPICFRAAVDTAGVRGFDFQGCEGHRFGMQFCRGAEQRR